MVSLSLTLLEPTLNGLESPPRDGPTLRLETPMVNRGRGEVLQLPLRPTVSDSLPRWTDHDHEDCPTSLRPGPLLPSLIFRRLLVTTTSFGVPLFKDAPVVFLIRPR